VIICHVVKEFLCVQSATEEESKITVSSFNDVSDFIDSFAAVEGILVRESIFDTVGDRYAVAERLGHAREKCRIYDGCFAYRSSERCWGGSALKHGRYIWSRATLWVHIGPNGVWACRHGHCTILRGAISALVGEFGNCAHRIGGTASIVIVID